MRLVIAAVLVLAPTPSWACQPMTTVFFSPGSVAVDEAGRAAIGGFAMQLVNRGGDLERVVIVGHSDRTGSPAARQRIALRRAEIVRDLLMANGVSAGLISVSGASDRAPMVDTADNVPEPRNQRVQLSAVFQPSASADSGPPTVC